MPGVSDSRWAAQDTTPAPIEAALRELLKERHAENESLLPARVLNMVCVVDKAWSGEIANRLRARRALPRLAHDRARGRAQAHAARRVGHDRQRRAPQGGRVRAAARDGRSSTSATAPAAPGHDRRPARRHRPADRAVVAARPPRGGRRAARPGPGRAAGLGRRARPRRCARARARARRSKAYVVDLAWLRSTPWRERVAATFDPPALRPTLRRAQRGHGPPPPRLDGRGAAARRLAGLAAGLAAVAAHRRATARCAGKAHARRQEVDLSPGARAGLSVRGLAGLTLETASGRRSRSTAGPAACTRQPRDREGHERELDACSAPRAARRGILGEGVRQALLRDPTYRPALDAAERARAVNADTAPTLADAATSQSSRS